jgi:hypothetical protein
LTQKILNSPGLAAVSAQFGVKTLALNSVYILAHQARAQTASSVRLESAQSSADQNADSGAAEADRYKAMQDEQLWLKR